MSQKRLKKQRFVAFFALFFNKKKRKTMNLRGYHRFNYMQHWVHVNTQEVKLSNISLFFNSCVTDRQMVPYLECSHPSVKWITCKKTKKKTKNNDKWKPRLQQRCYGSHWLFWVGMEGLRNFTKTSGFKSFTVWIRVQIFS